MWRNPSPKLVYFVAKFGPFYLTAYSKMVKCDGCYVRLHHGLKPACVKACPTGALKLVDLDAPEEIASENSLRHRSMELLERQV